MGCANSHQDSQAKTRSKEIDRLLEKDKKYASREVKFLLLGPGESGKTTILRQMKIIHDNGYSPEECEQFRYIVYSNIIQSMKTILKGRKQLNIAYSNPEREEDENTFNDLNEIPIARIINKALADSIRNLWSDKAIQETIKFSSMFQLNDSAEYFLSNMERIAAEDYLPNETDVLRTRVQTLGVVEYRFTYSRLSFLMVDVGGQKTERKKWIHCFEFVTAILFLVALSDFDLQLREDDETNRMVDSLELFDSISNNQYFKNTSIILFLNKKDLFFRKLKSVKLSDTFPEYTGDNSYESATMYFRSKFESLYKVKTTGHSKDIYTHFTCATDTGNVDVVFRCATDIIIRENLQLII